MPSQRPQDEPPVARKVLRYFVRNPQAADDLRGVVRWRLLEEAIQRNVEEASAALHWLVEQNFLVEEPRPGSGSIFRLNQERAAEAKRFLRQAEPGTSQPEEK